MRTHRLLAGGAAALGAGILAVGPLSAAAGDDDDRGGWVDDVLEELVEDGTLTQEQADAVADALEEARPEHGPFGGPWLRHGIGLGPTLLEDAADAIGVDLDELLDSLRDGDTIADVAEEHGVDAKTVIDAVMATVKEHLDEAVADGDIDQDEADERLADARERITELVEEGFEVLDRLPFPRPDGGGLRERGHWGPWHHGGD